MCGIYATTGDPASAADAVARLAHRGPDHQGTTQAGPVTFGHTRLSVIDLAERSNQPLTSASGNTTIVCNGEIYNYRELRTALESAGVRFKTQGDIEVILEGYEREGEEFFTKLRGMWALVIYDRTRGRLVATRDPFGIKPLFYTEWGAHVFFSSELRALKGMRTLEPNPAAFAVFYNLGYFIAPATPYKNVYKVRPGEVLAYSLNERKIAHLASVPRLAGEARDAGTTDLLDEALTESVERHYEADVPVSILLSGGNDSSLIAALSVKLGKKPDAYHVAVAGSEDTRYAVAVAKHLGLTLHIEELTEAALKAQYERAWSVPDEPTGDLSIIPTSLIYEKIKGASKVVLSGEGGDELFGGYLRHRVLARHTAVHATDPLATFNALLGATPLAISKLNPVIQRVRAALLERGVPNDLVGAYLKSTRLMDYPLDEALVRERLVELYTREAYDGLSPTLALDTLAYLPNDLLPKSDAASMASSIEARVPLVDRFLAKAASSALAGAPPVGDKALLKAVLARYLPQELVYRSKKGFGVPMRAYDSAVFQRDFTEAARFHLLERTAFGVSDSLAALLSHSASLPIILAKYPRFAYALISNWKYFRV